MNPPAYAHSLPGQPPDKWQPLDEHLKAVAEMAREFAAEFDSGDWAYNAGWLHDLGKAHLSFQSYLRRENGLEVSEYDGETAGDRVNHSGAGAIFATEKWPQQNVIIGKTFAYLVAGHHAGLPDWHGGQAALSYRIEAEKAVADTIRVAVQAKLAKLPQILRPPPFAMQCRNSNAVAYHCWVRMLFSCLVDADFLDTEMFMDGVKAGQRPTFPSLSELKSRFDRQLDKMTANAPDTTVNRIRADILAACRQAAEQFSGFFTLTVPTGGGKTLSGTAFALGHAVHHGKSRIIYVIPYTSIIEQTADVLRQYLGNDNVVEHHSNLAPEKETPTLALAAENWDAPVIVTTNVQFFESLYTAKPGRCRKLHNLVNSVIILDEAQLLPPEWLHPCVEALNRLVSDYGATVVFSTATQPALPNLYQVSREIIPDPVHLYGKLKRVEIRFPRDINQPQDWPSLAAELSQHQQTLCIVNRRQDCHELWKAMPAGAIHLSALMCGEHRSRVIADIKAKLKAGAQCRVISTQLVEAGVDLDFPVVYRALAGLDSINQAAGRCNREGKLTGLGEVHVFIPPSPAPIGLLLKGEQTTRALAALPDFAPDAPTSFSRFFEQFYASVNDHGETWLMEKLVRDVNPDGNVQFRTAGEEFRMIKDASVPVVVRYADNDKLIERLRFAGPTREIMRALQRYTVTVSPKVAFRLEHEGFVEKLHDGILVQTDTKLYNETVGLDIYRKCYAPEDLCV